MGRSSIRKSLRVSNSESSMAERNASVTFFSLLSEQLGEDAG